MQALHFYDNATARGVVAFRGTDLNMRCDPSSGTRSPDAAPRGPISRRCDVAALRPAAPTAAAATRSALSLCPHSAPQSSTTTRSITGVRSRAPGRASIGLCAGSSVERCRPPLRRGTPLRVTRAPRASIAHSPLHRPLARRPARFDGGRRVPTPAPCTFDGSYRRLRHAGMARAAPSEDRSCADGCGGGPPRVRAC